MVPTVTYGGSWLTMRRLLSNGTDRYRSLLARSTSDSERPFLTLERAVGDQLRVDDDLWETGAFNACVYPDLPVATNFRDVFSFARPAQDRWPSHWTEGDLVPRSSGKLVRTVACQVRSEREFRDAVRRASGSECGTSQPADALLVVGGSHPLRQMNGKLARALFIPAERGVEVVRSMQAAGEVPPELDVWAVANPLQERPGMLRPKIDAGATTVLTQPPLSWTAFEAWMEGVVGGGMERETRIVAGLPIVSSPGNMQFWGVLCGALANAEVQENVREFAAQQSKGKESFIAFRRQWAADMAQKLARMTGVSGAHVMALTGTARSDLMALLTDGRLQ